jgi:hypothetical protein
VHLISAKAKKLQAFYGEINQRVAGEARIPLHSFATWPPDCTTPSPAQTSLHCAGR